MKKGIFASILVLILLCGCGNSNNTLSTVLGDLSSYDVNSGLIIDQESNFNSSVVSDTHNETSNNSQNSSTNNSIVSSKVNSMINNDTDSDVYSVDSSTQSEPEVVTKKLVAFAFDDAPKDVTQDFVDLFYMNEARCTLFVVGSHINPGFYDVLRDAVDVGIELGNHSQSHNNMTSWNANQIKADFTQNQNLVKDITGYEMKIARLPGLAGNDTIYSVLEEMELPMIHASGWLVDYESTYTSERFYNDVRATIFDGAIYCCHNMPNTLTAMERLIPELQAEGYEFVTVSELFERRGVTAPLGVQIKSVSPSGLISTIK